jgi:hypothetical protein
VMEAATKAGYALDDHGNITKRAPAPAAE